MRKHWFIVIAATIALVAGLWLYSGSRAPGFTVMVTSVHEEEFLDLLRSRSADLTGFSTTGVDGTDLYRIELGGDSANVPARMRSAIEFLERWGRKTADDQLAEIALGSCDPSVIVWQIDNSAWLPTNPRRITFVGGDGVVHP